MQFDLATQDAVVVFLTPGEVIVEEPGNVGQVDDTDPSGQTQDQPFLSINERTSYKTQEDAIKGFNEAQKRITSLSAYEKVLKDAGAPDGADAEYLKGVISEYIRLATEAKAAKSPKPKTTSSSEEDKEFEGVDPQIVAQTKRGRQWLKDNAGKVGLVSQEKFDALQAEIAELKGGFSQKAKDENDSAIADGQSKVTSWLQEAKVDLNDEEREELEDMIVVFIQSKPQLEKQWVNGDRSQKIDLIRKGFEKVLPVVKPGASPALKAANTAAAGKTKQNLINRTKVLPKTSGSSDLSSKGKTPRIGSPELRNLAMDIMKKREAEMSGAGD